MNYRKLGDTNILVSEICLGTMTWGEQNSEREAHAQLDVALEHKINFIDTAELYPVPPRPETQGRTEKYIGSWLKKQNRQELIIASKVAGPSLQYFRGGSSLTKDQIFQAVDQSLKYLDTDYIDLYQLHWPERNTNFFSSLGFTAPDKEKEEKYQNSRATLQDSLEALDKLIQAGKIHHIGISNETPWGVSECLRLAREKNLPRVVSIQNPYNLLNRSYEVGLAEFHFREKVGLLAYSPLAFGMLTGKYLDSSADLSQSRLTLFKRFGRYTSEQAKKATQAYVDIAQKHGMSPTQLALAFINQQSFVTSNIIGATTLEQLKENITSNKVVLNEEILQEIEKVHEIYTYPCP